MQLLENCQEQNLKKIWQNNKNFGSNSNNQDIFKTIKILIIINNKLRKRKKKKSKKKYSHKLKISRDIFNKNQ